MPKPWREIITPHPDIAAGKFRRAEFAADLAQVLAKKAGAEYQDPAEFFSRTYLTEGMTRLLASSVARLAGRGGEPVALLKTSFGGGKTHAMIALYHLLGGDAGSERLDGVSKVMEAAGLSSLPRANAAVLAGTALSPGTPRLKKGNLTVNTLWGEMAWQLGGRTAYDIVANSDAKGVAPGSDDILKIFESFSPCVVLLDEPVAYCRNICGVEGLPAGSFDANMTFLQALTEAARRSKRALVLASVPESEIEAGGAGGRAALERIANTFGRLESVWKPAGRSEGFEIVRRRLFAPGVDESARDETCRAFSGMYAKAEPGVFPPGLGENAYLERMRAAFPIHPEVFDLLNEEWSLVEGFQGTRGVLRLMAAAVHELWARNDDSPMIMPGTIPLYAKLVRNELLRHLPERWDDVVERDVDGERSEPRRIDAGNPRFGAVCAARRVARTIFIGSAPGVSGRRFRGVADFRVRLGVVQPGESPAVHDDALGKLSERLSYLHCGENRFWFDVLPNLRKTADERAGRFSTEDVEDEILKRLKSSRERACFKDVHLSTSPKDVPDDREVRLVVLKPGQGHKSGKKKSAAISAALEILESRGDTPRLNRNMLVFLAPDIELVKELIPEVKRYLSWKSVVEDSDALNLDAFQRGTAAENRDRSSETVALRIRETYCRLLAPKQEGGGAVEWDAIRLQGGSEDFATRAAAKLVEEELLIEKWAPALLRMELDRWLWKDAPHFGVGKLWECMAAYCYLPRLKNAEVLLDAIREGIRSRDHFGYSAGITCDGGYSGLQFGEPVGPIFIDKESLLVRPEAAMEQIGRSPAAANINGLVTGDNVVASSASRAASDRTKRKRFHGRAPLDATKIVRDAGRIAEEIVRHLAALEGVKVEVSMEIRVEAPDGVPDDVARTVAENCATLKFKTHGFEDA